jgi:hypothetical protein
VAAHPPTGRAVVTPWVLSDRWSGREDAITDILNDNPSEALKLENHLKDL